MRARAFVERLLRRWRIEHLSVAPLGLIFQRHRAARSVHTSIGLVQDGSSFVLRSRIDLTIVRPVVMSVQRTSHTEGAVVRETRDRLVLRRATAAPVERVVRRLLSQGGQSESSVLDHSSPRRSAATSRTTWPSTVLVLRRDIVRESRPAGVDVRTAPHATEVTGARIASTTMPEALVPQTPLNVDALTDRVVAAIDRRIVAEAERTGRI